VRQRRPAAAREHPEADQMQVDGMVDVGDQPPHFDLTESDGDIGAGGIERQPADQPSMAAAHPPGAEGEVAHPGGVRPSPGRQIGGERAGDTAVVGGGAGDAEGHHVAGTARAQPVEESDAAADRDTLEVDDHVVAFGGRHRQQPVGDRRGEKPLVGADLDEIEPAPVVGDRFEFIVAGVGGVEDAQPVAGRVDLLHGPRGAVDQDHIAEDAGEILLAHARSLPQGGVEAGVGESAVGGERTVGDHQR
jgi:hypothetical protein